MSLLSKYRQAARESRRSLPALLIEAGLLRMAPNKLGLTEYIDFQLYKNDLDAAEKRSFGGQRAQAAIEDLLVDDYSKFLSIDKVTMYGLLTALSFPVPTVRALYKSMRPRHFRQIQSNDELAQYLSTPGNTPVYLKRSFGAYGRGNTLVAAVDGSELILGRGERIAAREFAAEIDDGRSLGWILQDPLDAHEDIVRLTGQKKISGMRIHTFHTGKDVRIVRAMLKINVGTKDSDNFEHGASGNLLAAVDVNSGMIVRTVSGVGFGQTVLQAHPKTGIGLDGFRIPHWQQVVELVKDAQTAFPGFICPGWDIAVCNDGPKILEVNAFGDIDLPQHAYRSGFFGGDFLECLQTRNLGELMNASSADRSRSAFNGRIGIKKGHWQW